MAVAFAAGGAGSVVFFVMTGASAILLLHYGQNEMSLAFALFFCLLPVANALLDWWSWAVSRWLGRDLHDLMSGRKRRLGSWLRRLFGRATMPAAFAVHVAADVLAAAAFLVGLAILLPFLVQLFNAGMVCLGEPGPIELRDYLQAVVANPWPDGAWALSMLLTTLIPTFLHAIVALITLFMWLIQPTHWRRAIVDGLSAEDLEARRWAILKATWLVILTPIVAGVVVVTAGYVLWQAVDLVGRPVAGWLHEAALLGIDLANGLARALGLLL